MQGEGSAEGVVVRYARCFHHRAREAVARCPICGRTFCRECITEHRGRVLCAACLKAAAVRRGSGPGLRRALVAVAVAAGVMMAWLFFHGLGRLLLRIPTPFHDGTIWLKGPEEPGP